MKTSKQNKLDSIIINITAQINWLITKDIFWTNEFYNAFTNETPQNLGLFLFALVNAGFITNIGKKHTSTQYMIIKPFTIDDLITHKIIKFTEANLIKYHNNIDPNSIWNLK